MITNKLFNITKEDRKNVEVLLIVSPTMTIEEAVLKYQNQLDKFCFEFNASSYQELMNRADGGEFSPKISSIILDSYSFLIREHHGQ